MYIRHRNFTVTYCASRKKRLSNWHFLINGYWVHWREITSRLDNVRNRLPEWVFIPTDKRLVTCHATADLYVVPAFRCGIVIFFTVSGFWFIATGQLIP